MPIKTDSRNTNRAAQPPDTLPEVWGSFRELPPACLKSGEAFGIIPKGCWHFREAFGNSRRAAGNPGKVSGKNEEMGEVARNTKKLKGDMTIPKGDIKTIKNQ